MNWKLHLSSWATILRTIRRNLLKSKLEPECGFLQYLIQADSTCFDVGAAQGRYTLVMSQLARAGHVYSFEPGDYFFRILSVIKVFHRLKNVTLVKTAVGDKSGWGWLVIPLKKSRKPGFALAHLASDGDHGFIRQKVPVTSLDEFSQEKGINKVNFIKCDVEGSELLVFKGARKLLERCRPIILCELSAECLARTGSCPRDVFAFLDQLGYRAYILRKNLSPVNPNETYNFFFIDRFRIAPPFLEEAVALEKQ
ncbi:MAG: FkbM family methyltransferase [Candidatus Omnitrophica bacterium]|nr:FkbM family methyltransferase [Candidatus Omnitrophota bacterium]